MSTHPVRPTLCAPHSHTHTPSPTPPQGNVTVLGRESPFALYSADLASMEIEGGGAAFDYNPYDAQGFIRINAVRLRAYNHLQRTFDTK